MALKVDILSQISGSLYLYIYVTLIKVLFVLTLWRIKFHYQSHVVIQWYNLVFLILPTSCIRESSIPHVKSKIEQLKLSRSFQNKSLHLKENKIPLGFEVCGFWLKVKEEYCSSMGIKAITLYRVKWNCILPLLHQKIE